MAKLTHSLKTNIFSKLNDLSLPWGDCRFVIDEEGYKWLGNGGFSEVCLMEDKKDSSVRYAVKIIGFPEQRRIHDLAEMEAYKKEAILQFGLCRKCKYIVKTARTKVLSVRLDENGNVLEVKNDGSGVEQSGWLVLAFIRMEYLLPVIKRDILDDLEICIAALKEDPDREALKLAIHIGEALSVSHALQVMHRDVKLENIFYDAQKDLYKLGDFGIARVTNQGNASTKGAGTLGYEAPEVEGGDDDKYCYQADIYSFGVTIYLLMNDLKFPGSSGYYVNRSVQYRSEGVVEKPLHGCDRLKELICSCIQYDSSERPTSMQEVLKQLKSIYLEQYGNADFVTEDDAMVKVSKKMEPGRLIAKISKTYDGILSQEKAFAKEKMWSKPQEDVSDVGERTEVNGEPGTVSVSFGGWLRSIVGVLMMIAGITYFVIIKREDMVVLVRHSYFWVSLVVGLLFVIGKLNSKRMAALRFLPLAKIFLVCAFVFLAVLEGFGWFYWLFVGLFLFGSTLGMLSVIVPGFLAFFIVENGEWITKLPFVNEKNAWLYFAMICLGAFLKARLRAREDITDKILSVEGVAGFLGLIFLFVGLVIWVLYIIPMVSVNQFWENLHFIRGGLILLAYEFWNILNLGKQKGNE